MHFLRAGARVAPTRDGSQKNNDDGCARAAHTPEGPSPPRASSRGSSSLVVVDLDGDTRGEGRRLQLLVLLHLHALRTGGTNEAFNSWSVFFFSRAASLVYNCSLNGELRNP